MPAQTAYTGYTGNTNNTSLGPQSDIGRPATVVSNRSSVAGSESGRSYVEERPNVKSDEDVCADVMKNPTYVLYDGTSCRFKCDELFTKITFITAEQEQGQLRAERQNKPPPNLAMIDRTIFFVDIVHHNVDKTKKSTLFIKHKSLMEDDKTITRFFTFRNQEEMRLWNRAISIMLANCREVFEKNPQRLVMEKLWLVGDASGDGGVDGSEIESLLDRINIVPKPSVQRSIVMKIKRDLQKKKKKGNIPGLDVIGNLGKLRGPPLQGITLDRGEFEKFIYHLQNHDVVEALWPMYARGPKLDERQLIAFFLKEQSEDLSKDKYRVREMFENCAGPGRALMSKRGFEILLRQSRLNSIDDVKSEQTIDADEEALPIVDYAVNTALHPTYFIEELMVGSSGEDQTDAALAHYVEAGVRSFVITVADVGGVLHAAGENVKPVPLDGALKKLSQQHRKHTEKVCPLFIHLMFMPGTNEAAQAKAMVLVRTHFAHNLFPKDRAPWELFPGLEAFEPPMTDAEREREEEELALLQKMRKGKGGGGGAAGDVVNVVRLCDLYGKVFLSVGWDTTNFEGEFIAPDWADQVKSVAHLQAVPISTLHQKTMTRTRKILSIEATIAERIAPLVANRRAFIRQLRNTPPEEHAALKAQSFGNLLLPLVAMNQLHFAELAMEEHRAEEAIARANKKRIISEAERIENPTNDENIIHVGQDPAPANSVRQLTRAVLTMVELLPTHDKLGNERTQDPESYVSAGWCWANGVQFVGVSRREYFFKAQDQRSGSEDYRFKTSPYRTDISWILCNAYFRRNNKNGFIKKPWNMCCQWEHTQRVLAEKDREKAELGELYIRRPVGSCTYMIRIISGQALPEKSDSDSKTTLKDIAKKAIDVKGNFMTVVNLVRGQKQATVPDPFVEVRVDGDRVDYANNVMDSNNSAYYRTKTVMDNGFCPMWDERVSIRLKRKEGAFVTLSVWAEDPGGKHALLAQGCVPVATSRLGYRTVFLYDTAGLPLPTCPTLLVHVSECRDGEASEVAKEIDELAQEKKKLMKKLADLKTGAAREKETFRNKAKQASKLRNDKSEEQRRLEKLEGRMCHCGLLDPCCIM
eukprot:PhM_4_TR1021/c0_g1_i1/m.32752